MKNPHKTKPVEQLLAEADELMLILNENITADVKDDLLLQLEIHAEHLKNIKADVQAKAAKTTTEELMSSSEGMHEAIIDIIAAMHDLKNKIF